MPGIIADGCCGKYRRGADVQVGNAGEDVPFEVIVCRPGRGCNNPRCARGYCGHFGADHDGPCGKCPCKAFAVGGGAL